ncbi:MAG: GIY-YIG nuclease family protein [Crocinitomicaceae bacterium]|nr:GIY-YIG nuclease family protein [Crocinitomicaceae bacterium]
MLFAITDIETTGSYASGNSITEIAICLHDGHNVLHSFSSLVNPGIPVPRFISTLTGITDEMLRDAPAFSEIACEVYRLLSDAVFVAHNVNFDHSFIKAELETLGYRWRPKKLCTARFARKAFPGLRSYGLAHLCRELNIVNRSPHRALGDTLATVELFERSLQTAGEEMLMQMISQRNSDAFLPNHISEDEYHSLPEKVGVYYFYDNRGKPIYIGKAVNIKKRVHSHFRDAQGNKRLQDFLREIHRIDFHLTGNELIALLMEDAEIRKYWPRYNSAQKKKANKFSVFEYIDQRGYLRLGINKVSTSISPVKTFTSIHIAQRWVKKLGEENSIDMRLLGFPGTSDDMLPAKEVHNELLANVLSSYKTGAGNFIFYSTGRKEGEYAFVLVKEGELRGFGYIPGEVQISSPDILENWLQRVPPSETNTSVMRSFIENPRNLRLIKF